MKKEKLKGIMIGLFLILFVIVFCIAQVVVRPCGDVNSSGVVDVVDALMIAKASAGLTQTNYNSSVADVSGDGAVTVLDALLVARYSAGLISSFAGCNNTATPTPTPIPTLTPTPTGAPGTLNCFKYATWSAKVTFQTSGARVIYNGNLYESRWYNVDQNPELYHGSSDPWTLLGPCDPNTVPKPITPLAGANGYATRYWDCCKPHCSWDNNPPKYMPPLKTCAKDGRTGQSDTLLQSACSGGPAYTCYALTPWAINSNLSYAYAATSSGDVCGRCFELTFTGEGHYGFSPGAEAIQGKKMIVQAINIGYDVAGGQVDIMIPGGGVGAFDACSTQWGVSKSELGAQYGGLLSACQEQYGYQDLEALKSCLKAKNNALFRSRGLTEMADGLDWFIDWYQAADNPNVIVKEVTCPLELINKSGLQRQ